MQRFVLKNKNKITLISGVLIIIAFTNKWLLNNNDLFITSLILASLIAVMPIAIQAYQALRVKVVSIDLLVTIAVIGAFFIKNFEESAIVTFLFLFGAYLEQRTLNHTRSAIKELTDLSPDTAFKKTVNGEFEEVDVEDVDIGDILLVKTGAKVPVDGTIIIGEAIIDQSSITGEPVPVRKVKGANVFAGTIVDNGTIQVVASKVGEETTFGKIIELVEEAQDSKSEAERFIDKFSKWYTPVILIIGIIVWIVSKNVELAITILVLGCPGALVIGVPVSNIASIGNGARNGILIKGSEVIDDLSRLDTIVFDKTGTLTIGSPAVDEKFYFDDNINYYSSLLASIEKNSDHPLAKAVLEDIENTKYFDVDNIKVLKGEGIRGDIDGKSVLVGNLSSMEKENVELKDDVKEKINLLESQGNSIVMMSVDKKLKILLAIKDKIRPGIKNQLGKLKDLGVKSFIILSGDNKGSVDLVGKELEFDQAYGNMLPEDKARFVKKLIDEKQIVAFVGDGINDSPSIATANIGIAVGSGTDVAIETSDVVLMNSDLSHLPHALGLAKATSRNMIQNIVIAIGVVIFLLLGVLFGDWMNMSIGMLLHEASILVVILNGMRLLRYKIR